MSAAPSRRDEARDASMEVAEHAREAARTRPSLAAGIFLGALEPGLVLPFPEQDAADRAHAEPFLARLRETLARTIDADRVDREGRLPPEALEALHAIGAFRLKIDPAYGGLGFSQQNYNRVVALTGAHCASTAIWLSAHQSIGVPNPLAMVGTEAQKQRWLPRLASGALSAFALTEPDVGSDPARMRTRAEPHPDGGWTLRGEKLWCTNGPVADVMIVMARTPDRMEGGRSRPSISAFVVERAWPGVVVAGRCEFAGYHGIENGWLRFEDVRLPPESLLGGEGLGLKLAFRTLNTGRLTLPATNAAVAAACSEIACTWAGRREQWGAPIGTHEAVGVQVAWIASHAFAMQALCDYVAALADRGDTDIRIEAALAKLFCSETLLGVVERTMQVRGGRGYETVRSLTARGEEPWPVERMWREARLNTIVEGTSEVLRLFLAREALDPHLTRAGAFARPGAPFLARAKGFLACAAYYPFYWLKRMLPRPGTPSGLAAPLRAPWRALERGCRSLARRTLYAMLRFGPGLEHRQALLGRLVDDGGDLIAMAATLSRASSLGDARSIALAGLFCRHAEARMAARRASRAGLDRAGLELARELIAPPPRD
jgi:alkylation response protein AidB-like acyl-CoA dehydrogenase